MSNNFIFDLFGGVDLISAVLSTLVPLSFLLLFALIAIWLERKISAHMQDRLGPMRTGWHGALQTIADMLKLLQKEDLIATDNDKKLFIIAPYLVFAGSYAAFAAIPFSSAYLGSNIDLGLLYIVAVSGFVVAGILMAGWASNNKYALYGAVRSAAQMISYEIPTVLVIVMVITIAGTLNLYELSEMQTSTLWNWWIFGGAAIGWKKFVLIPFMIAGFLMVFISSLAEVNRVPFDIPEAESELVAGYFTEYSGLKWGMFMLSEYMNMYAVSAIMTAVFFGGYQSPFGYLGNTLGVSWLVPIEQFGWFTIKGMTFIFLQMWLRWTLPRLRVDQLMALCWKYLIPIAFVNLLLVALIVVL
jgi:NADH-quinone oxidoreductase subunit H